MILVAVALAVLLLSLMFRVNAVYVFLGMAAGVVLQAHLSESFGLAIDAVAKDLPVILIADVFLLAAPIIAMLFLMRKTMRHHMVVVQIVPLVAVSLAVPLVALPVLPEAFQLAVAQDELGAVYVQAADVVISIAAVLSLVLAWRTYGLRDLKHHK